MSREKPCALTGLVTVTNMMIAMPLGHRSELTNSPAQDEGRARQTNASSNRGKRPRWLRGLSCERSVNEMEKHYYLTATFGRGRFYCLELLPRRSNPGSATFRRPDRFG